MNLRWLIFDHVDPELGLSKPERKRIRARAWNLLHLAQGKWATGGYSPGQRRPPKWAIAASIMAPGAAAFFPVWVMHLMGPPRMNIFIGVIVVEMVFVWLTVAWLAQWTWRPFVAQALREAGHPICKQCGYRLASGQVGSRCSECGQISD
jgi:hypothetical protein